MASTALLTRARSQAGVASVSANAGVTATATTTNPATPAAFLTRARSQITSVPVTANVGVRATVTVVNPTGATGFLTRARSSIVVTAVAAVLTGARSRAGVAGSRSVLTGARSRTTIPPGGVVAAFLTRARSVAQGTTPLAVIVSGAGAYEPFDVVTIDASQSTGSPTSIRIVQLSGPTVTPVAVSPGVWSVTALASDTTVTCVYAVTASKTGFSDVSSNVSLTFYQVQSYTLAGTTWVPDHESIPI